MNYYGPYDPHDPYNLLPITALLLMSSSLNPRDLNLRSIDREKRHLDFSYLNGTACPSNEFQDKLNQEIANAVSIGYNGISSAMWEDTCCAVKDEQNFRLLQNQANSLKIRQAMQEIETENLYENVINQLRSCFEPPRYTAFYCDDRPILVHKHKAAGWMSEYSEPVEFNNTFYKSLCETAQKEKSEAKTESIGERENPIMKALRKFVEFLNEFVDLFIADWD